MHKLIQPKSFTAKDGRKFTLRTVKWEDLTDLLDFINSLVEEGADVIRTVKVLRDEEAEWLGKLLARIEKGEVIDRVAEMNGKVVAHAEVGRRTGLMSHVGELGIAIKQGYRGIGIGTILMQTLINESRSAGLKVLVLDVFGTNNTAKALYTKMGFKDAGKIPRAVYKNGKYVDLIRMTLEL